MGFASLYPSYELRAGPPVGLQQRQ